MALPPKNARRAAAVAGLALVSAVGCAGLLLAARESRSASRLLSSCGGVVIGADDDDDDRRSSVRTRDVASLHDRRPDYREAYDAGNAAFVESFPMTDRELPRLRTFRAGGGEGGGAVYYSVDATDGRRCGKSAFWWRGTRDRDREQELLVPPEHFSSGRDPCWKDPSDGPHLAHHREGNFLTVTDEHVAAYASWFPDNYGHFLHDHVPNIAWLRQTLPAETKIVLDDAGLNRKIIAFLDRDFAENRVLWLDARRRQVLKVEGDQGSLTVVENDRAPPINMGTKLWAHFRRWIAEVRPKSVPPGPDRTVVFYTRAGSRDTFHGRVVEPAHEKALIDLVRSKMDSYGRPERLVVFNGLGDDGRTMSLEGQFDLFRSASAIVGPHGSGLANVIWTHPYPRSCKEVTSVIEFTPGLDSDKVQPSAQMTRHYFPAFRGLPLDWHHVLYTAASDPGTTYVHVDMLEEALDAIWGQGENKAGGEKKE